MKDSQIKINNSFESEPSSSSGSCEINADDNKSFEHQTPTLTEMFKPHYYENEKLHKSKQQNNLIITKISNYSSQESDFEGFTENQINNSPSIQNDTKESKELKNDYHLYSKNELNNVNNIENPIINNVIIYDPQEDSCNAVDMKLSTDIPKKSMKNLDLTFNGKIKNDLKTNIKNNDEIVKIEFMMENNNNNNNNNTFMYENERSPDIFEDSDNDDNDQPINKTSITFIDENNTCTTDLNSLSDIKKNEQELLQRIQTSLSGLPPPPSVTNMQMDMHKIISDNKDAILKFSNNIYKTNNDDDNQKDILFKPTHTFDEMKNTHWPNILNVRHHGLSFNLSKTTEKIEYLSMAVVERYVGVETRSSFINYSLTSSPKKRNIRLKMLNQSPGNRLSHLAKRRAIFSSANLQSTSQNSAAIKSTKREILLDTRRNENRRKLKIATPKRRTPGRKKSIVRKAPTSSAKKKLFSHIEMSKPGPSRETSKRALFQSPPKQKPTNIPKIKPEIANRVEKSKRALFSPFKSQSSNCSQDSITSSLDLKLSQPFSNQFGIKRKRENDVLENTSKISRTAEFSSSVNADNLTPRSLRIKSQSFCVGGAGTQGFDEIDGKSLLRARSDNTFNSSQLTDTHKKKLLWAVSQALQYKQISVTHPNFKQYASVLARVVRRLFLDSPTKTGVSDKMLRLAKAFVYLVIQGRTVDDIYLFGKSKIQHVKQTTKLTGYIAPEEYENHQKLLKRQSSLFSSENSFDSFNLSQPSGFTTQFSSQASINSQSTEYLNQINDSKSNINNAIKLPIQINKTLQNSSSKNNLNSLALRENFDCEQQKKSAQKNFTGKDQKNVSPFADKSRSGLKKHSSMIFSDINPMKAKRQISFDC